MKFLGYLKLRKLKDTILLPLSAAKPEGFDFKNEEVFAELIQFLDDRSLSLVMRDAADDGRKALKILRDHYAGTGKPRIISLYTELTSLIKKAEETVTDYLIKAETAATALRNAGEDVSDGLLVAMTLKGLPEVYKPFIVVITQREGELTFQEFKVMLRNYESTENARRTSDDDSVMQAPFRGKCFACGKWGHMSKDCDLKTGPNQVSGRKPKMWCSFCQRANHTDRTCRRKKGASKDSSRYVNSDVNGDSGGCHSFVFLSTEETPNNPKNTLLVDCGATAHIITDQSYFVGYDRNFQKANHFIELADGTRSNNVALKRGNAVMMLTDVKGRKVVDGKNISSTDKFNCETCVMSKQTLTRSREPRLRTKNRLDLVHTDVVGPIEPMAKDGFRFGITFTDDYSGLIFVYFLKHKNQAVKALEQFLADTAPYGKTKCIRSDNGTEYTCKEFQDVLRKNLIKHETSAPYSPHQNGTAERGMRTLFEMARCLLQESGLPKNLWTYAVMASAYIRNRCYFQRIQQTPFYMFSDKKPNLNNMHILGRKCFVYETLPKKKLDARSREGIFVGYDKGSPAYLVYHPDTKNVKKYRCVKFF